MKDALALVLLIGEWNRDWILLILDGVEWTEPRYYHQN